MLFSIKSSGLLNIKQGFLPVSLVPIEINQIHPPHRQLHVCWASYMETRFEYMKSFFFSTWLTYILLPAQYSTPIRERVGTQLRFHVLVLCKSLIDLFRMA